MANEDRPDPMTGGRARKRRQAVRMLDDGDVERLLGGIEDRDDDEEGDEEDADRRD